MNASYRLGVSIVVGTLLLTTGLILWSESRAEPANRPAANDLGGRPVDLGAFTFRERSGRTITEVDTADRVWIASFLFTRCRSSCPRIAAVLKGLQARLAGTGVRLVSISVDPEHDTPEVLGAFADRYRADPDRWWFLTGPKAEIYDLILKRFQLGVAEAGPEDQAAGAEAVAHSTRLALVDRGNMVVGYFDADDPDAVAALEARARQMILDWMPALNAVLNATCAGLLLVGWASIRRGRLKRHMRCMVAALVISALFLGNYLVYHYLAGSVRFRGMGASRVVYLSILGSHTILAVVVVPLIGLTLVRALKRRFLAHAKLARVTFPIWFYVSITGVIVYLMLYQIDFSTTSG